MNQRSTYSPIATEHVLNWNSKNRIKMNQKEIEWTETKKKTPPFPCSTAYTILNLKRTMRMKRVNAFVIRLDNLFSFHECAQNDVFLSHSKSDSSSYSFTHLTCTLSFSVPWLLIIQHIPFFSEWNVITAVLRVTQFVLLLLQMNMLHTEYFAP